MITSYDLCGENPRPMTRDEVDSLKTLVSMLGDSPVVVQIGAGQGVSTLAMLEERPDIFIFSIDTGPCPQEYENIIKAGLDQYRVVRVLGYSQDIGIKWPYDVDMVFVDGDHSEKGVRGDIKAWLRKTKNIIAFHDYIPEPIPPEIKGRVVYAVDDLMSGYFGRREILRTDRLIAFFTHEL